MFRSAHFPYKAIFSSVLIPKGATWKAMALLGAFLKAKRNLEIVSKLAIFEASRVQVGEVVGVGGV